jgi:hypothetical protein
MSRGRGARAEAQRRGEEELEVNGYGLLGGEEEVIGQWSAVIGEEEEEVIGQWSLGNRIKKPLLI